MKALLQAPWWLAANLALAAVLAPLALVQLERLAATLDSEPVYRILAEPVAAPPVIRVGEPIRVRWSGYYRKDCPGLAYGRTLILETADGDVEVEKVRKPASSAVATEPKERTWSWQPVHEMAPGTYRWRSTEYAECVDGVTHVSVLAETRFTVVE